MAVSRVGNSNQFHSVRICSILFDSTPQIELEREAKELLSREKALVERSLAAEERLAEAMRQVGRRSLHPVSWPGLAHTSAAS